MAKKRTESTKERRDYDVPPKRFVEVWQRASSADEVAEILKMPKAIVHARASQYRARGTKLKSMPRVGRGTLDIEGLNALIEQIDSETESKKATKKSPPA